jgi:hypothetical protein
MAKSKDALLKEAKARGAFIVDDAAPTQGFKEDDANVACIGDDYVKYDYQLRYDDQAVLDMEKRAKDASAHIPEEIVEATVAAQEENADAVRVYRMRFQQDFKNWDKGRVIWIGDFLGMLQTIRPDAFLAETSFMGLRGIGFVGAHDVKQEDGTSKIEEGAYYSGVSYMNGNAPEWTKVAIDAHQLPTHEVYRGWRAVLLALIKKGIISEKQCDEVFGKPSAGPRSKGWHRGLWEVRNGKCGECRKETCDCADRFDFLRSDNYAYPIPEGIAKGQRQQVEPREAERRIILTD